MKEFIICSAIHVNAIGEFKDQPKGITCGFVVTGRRHSDCYEIINNVLLVIGKEESYDYIESLSLRQNQGFITNTNRFVFRDEAYEIANAYNQIKYGAKAVDAENRILISEMLY